MRAMTEQNQTASELGKAIQYYSDNHEQGGDMWLICKLNDIMDDIKELEHQNKVYSEALKAISKVNCSSYYYRAKASEALVEGER